MKNKEIERSWFKAQDLCNYHKQLRAITLHDESRTNHQLNIEFNSGITAICGKNGSGKSSLLRTIYNYFTNDSLPHSKEDLKVREMITVNQKGEAISSQDIKNVSILEPFSVFQKINEYISTTANIEELLEGVDYNDTLNGKNIREELSNVVGKSYSSIKVYEIEDIFPDDESFILPIFEVVTNTGLRYSNNKMGTGEFICIYMFWYLTWIEKETVLLIDELENSISAYSQTRLLDYIAKVSSIKGIWCVITTHSEHILHKVGLTNIRIVSELPSKGLHVVKPEHQMKYLNSLGVGKDITGSILLEDSCALSFCKEIINKFNPYFLREKELIGLNGESNIEKIIKHFKPHQAINYDLFAVFDADMSHKLDSMNKSDIKSIALPSATLTNPDIEIWDTLISNVGEISTRLDISNDIFEESIAENSVKDHHERLIGISNDINIPVDRVRASIIKIWIEINPNKAAEFALAAMTLGKEIESDKLNSVISMMETNSRLDLQFLRDAVSSSKCHKVITKFNGTELNIEPAA
ncbi:ATP-dependent endonuclease [Vibrio chagasii]|uniref:ATP-dependent nuclease n=4 Tax=Vibrio TaxID=662 RepID=UPI003552F954